MADIRHFMHEAIKEARKSLPYDIPVGCVIVRDGSIIARGHNTREASSDAVGHAEINAIREACANIDDWRLNDADLYVTLEPCPMCAGAIRSARIRSVYYGAPDVNEGAVGSVYNLLTPSTAVYPFIMKEECSDLLATFFRELRNSDDHSVLKA